MKQNELFSKFTTQLRESARSTSLDKYKPHPKQIEFHSSNVHGRAFLGGNRSGKTVGGAVECLWWMLGRHPFIETPKPPVRGRAVAVDWLDGVEKIMLPEIRKWVPKSALINGSWDSSYSKQHRTLTLNNGSFLEFMSYEQEIEKFAGTSRHFIWFDEEPPQAVFEECKLRLLDTYGSWWMTMTPVLGMTWVHDDIYLPAVEGDDPNLKVITVTTFDNTYIRRENIELIMSGLDDEAIKTRIEGLFIGQGGLIYRDFKESTHVIDKLSPDVVKQSWSMVAGMDHGFRNPTAWLWAVLNKEGQIIIFDELYESMKVVSQIAPEVLSREQSWGRRPDYRVGDPAIQATDPIVGHSIHTEYAKLGVDIILGINDQSVGLNRCIDYMRGSNGKPQLYVTRNCPNLIHELKRLKWDTFASKKIASNRNHKEGQVKKNDHACDAMRYMIMSRPEYEAPSSEKVPGLKELIAMSSTSVPVGGRVHTLRNRKSNTSTDMLGSEW